MERLTHERVNGIKTGYWSPEKKETLVNALAEYEGTGLTPEEIKMLNGKGADVPANNGWIPVEERLPEDEEMVLVTCKTKVGRLSVYRAWRGGGYWHGTESISDVIAWQPLPEPYRPERRDSHDRE